MTASNSEDDKESKENENKATLRIQNAKKRDMGRNIIRIDPEIMEKLCIQTGDVIALKGKKDSAGIAWLSYPQDKGLGIVRIDSRLRRNTNTSIDDTIEIRKVNVETARTMVLAPANVKIRSNPRFETFIKRKLHNYPITMDDIIIISIGISREITFKVINLRPEGVCIIKQETKLIISGRNTEEKEKGSLFKLFKNATFHSEMNLYDIVKCSKIVSELLSSDSIGNMLQDTQIFLKYYGVSIPDFYYEDAKLCVFVDGPPHGKEEQKIKDKEQRKKLRQLGNGVYIMDFFSNIEEGQTISDNLIRERLKQFRDYLT